jgi:hypothetical protein
MHGKAKEYAVADPEVSLMFARKTAEAFCKFMLSETNTSEVDNLMLERLIERLTREKSVPKRIVIHLRTIQLHGNFGSHDQSDDDTVDGEYVVSCIQSLNYSCDWLFNTYLPSNMHPPVLVKDFAAFLGVPNFKLIKQLMDDFNMFVNPNVTIDDSGILRKIAATHDRAFWC